MFAYVLAVLGLAAVTPQLFIIDLREHRLPNRLTGPAALWMIAAAAIGSLLDRSFDPLRASLLAGLASLVAYLVLFLASRGGFGLGDVKLGGVIGLGLGLAGATTAASAFVLGFLIGALWSLGLIVTRRAGLRTHIPFGPFMLVGAWIVVLGNGIVEQLFFGALAGR